MAEVQEGTALMVGSGLIGKSWAMIFARAGWRVRMYDSVEGVAERVVGSPLREGLESLHNAGLLNGQSVDEVQDRVSAVRSLSHALSDGAVSYIQEAVPEVVEVKKSVYSQLSEILLHMDPKPEPCRLLIGSSASNMPPSIYAGHLPAEVQAHIFGAHPVNPPFAVPIVELIPSALTDKEAFRRARAIHSSLGMKPISLSKEVPGFVVNRLQYALLGEAFRLVADGIASPDDVDTAITAGLGARWAFMGPFMTIDLNAPEGVRDYCDRYAAPLLEVLKTEDNTRDWDDATIRTLEGTARSRIPVEKIGEACAWRDERLLRLAVERNCAPPLPSLAYRVEHYPTPPPPVEDITEALKRGLASQYASVEVEWTECPDLREAPWGLERAGLGGEPVLIDMGGPYNVEHPAGHGIVFNTISAVAAIGRVGAWALGPGAASARVIGVNGELIANDDTAKRAASSYSSKVEGEGWVQEKYESHEVGPLANLLVTDGKRDEKVLHVRVSGRVDGTTNFVSAVRESLRGLDGVVAAGGVIRIGGENASVRAHVMPGFCDHPLTSPEQVREWLNFYDMPAPLTAVSTFVTEDMGADLRVEHTHFFSEHGACGHYHFDTTPECITYDAYYAIASSVYRVERPTPSS